MTPTRLQQLAERAECSPCAIPALPALHRLSPEGQGYLARILFAQHLRGDTVEVPRWRERPELPTEVQLTLMRLEISVAPNAFAGDDLTELLFNALLGMSAREVRTEDFDALAETIFGFGHPSLLAHLVTLADQQSERVDPRSLLALHQRLLGTSAALEALTRVHALGGDVPAYTTNAEVPQAIAAVRAHGTRGDLAVLRHVAGDTDTPHPVRCAAVVALGAHATRADLDAVLAWCHADAEHLAPACVDFLVALRHRGIFVQKTHLAELFSIALHAPSPLDALTAHLHAERLALLMQVDTDDRRLLTWLLALDVPENGLTPLLVRLLDSAVFSIRCAALECIARPEHRQAEDAVLALRDVHPDGARRALAVIGDEPTRRVLMDGFVTGEPALDERWLPVLVGLLPDDDPRLDTLLRRVPPDSPHAHQLWAIPPATAATRDLVRLSPGMNVVALVARLCASQSARVLPDLVYLLHRYTAALCDGQDLDGWGTLSTRPVLAPTVLSSLRGLGRALASRGSLLPLVGHVSAEQAPDALVRWLVVAAMAQAPGAASRAMLVRSVPLDGLPAAHLVAWGRTEDRALSRDVIGRMGEHRDVVTLGPYIIKAMASTDFMIARAGARAAVQQGLDAAVPALIDMLRHPKMDHKRIAARGLATLGDWRAIDPLLHWLGTHDNAGFRAELLAALRAIQPHGARGLIRSARADASGRRANLLARADTAIDATSMAHGNGPDGPPSLPLSVRAHQFHRAPTSEHLDVLLTDPLTDLSAEAQASLLWVEERLLDGLCAEPPADRDAREGRGRSARHLLQWLARQTVVPSERHRRIAALRRLPTLPMGHARWTALRALDAVSTSRDVRQALEDCTHTAHRDRDMHTILRACGVRPEARRDIVAATEEARDALLREAFLERPVSDRPWRSLDEEMPRRRRARPSQTPATTVGSALERGATIPHRWPWAPERWEEVVRLPIRRLPSSHQPLLRGLFVDALARLEATPDRIRWACSWTEHPTEVLTWLDTAAPSGPRTQPLVLGPPGDQVLSVQEALPGQPLEPSEVTERSMEDWIAALSEPDLTRTALRALSRHRGATAVAAVRPLLRDPSVRSAALRCLRAIAEPDDVHAILREMLTDRDDEWVRTGARILGHRRDPGSIRAFVKLLKHRSPGVRQAAREALALQPERALSELYPVAARARPDQRATFHDVIEGLEDLLRSDRQ